MKSASRVVSLLDEAFSGLWRARRMTVVSVLQIAVSVFLVGVFLLVSENLGGLVETLRHETAITVFLRPDTTAEERAELEKVARDSRLVAAVRHVTPDAAAARFAASWRTLAAATESLPKSPFPASLELDLAPDAASSAAVPALLRNLAARRAAEDVQFDVEWVRRLRATVNLVRVAGLAIGVVLALGAAFTIANVVRLTILLHREEIEILRLVGAPEVLIRGPFLLGGLLQGTLGGLVAVGLLALATQLLGRYAGTNQSALIGLIGLHFLSTRSAAFLVLGGLAAGLFGGVFAVRRRSL